ncbi:MAG: hypothetical protein O7J95_15405 [Planctomycetota bacterium]|nr:hypothetical protein [Planctomycetota bacterium]
MRWPRILAVLLLACAASVARGEDGWSFRPEHLEGPDERLGSVAALTLLQATDAPDPLTRKKHLEYVLARLRAESVGSFDGHEASALAVRRIVEGMAGLTATSGPPFPSAGKVLLGIIGRGPTAIRAAVVDALVAQVEWEATQRPAQGLLKDELQRLIVHNPPPDEARLADASRVLWRCDGKLFLAACIDGMRINQQKFPGSTDLYLKEIRSRLRIDFPSPGEWAAWWTERKEQSLSQIFAECQRLVSDESARQWRQVMKRLRETQDAEGVLASVGETLRVARGLELRLAAVGVLADFPDWVRDVKIPEGTSGAASVGDSIADRRGRLLSRAVTLLLQVARGEMQPHERFRVRRACLAALRKYQTHLERSAEQHALVTQLVLGSLDRLLETAGRGDLGASRGDLLEAFHTAGALQLIEARQKIEGFLRSSTSSGDLELLTAAAAALGRLVKSGMPVETARLYFALYALDGERSPAQVKALRRACTAALNARPGDEASRGELRRFHSTILAEGPGALRIPAILGLGTLAQDRDDEALKTLVAVVARHATFEAQEVIAALDAVAYVGGVKALERLLPLLGTREELHPNKTVYEYLWKTIVGLVQRGGRSVLAWSVAFVEGRAVAQDSPVFLEFVLLLAAQPELATLFSPEQIEEIDPADAQALQEIWRTALTLARATELLDESAADPTLLRRLEELGGKNAEVAKRIPADVAAVAAYREARTTRSALAAKLQDLSPRDPAQLATELASLIEPGSPALERWYAFRWVESRLAVAALRRQEKAPALYKQWIGLWKGDVRAAVFEGLPASFRDDYWQRLEALIEAAPRAPKEEPSSDGAGKGGGGAAPTPEPEG